VDLVEAGWKGSEVPAELEVSNQTIALMPSVDADLEARVATSERVDLC
jgi:hypothetical protein